MGIFKSAADLVYTIRFLKLLVTPFEKTAAFKTGLIDKAGKRIKGEAVDSPEKKSAYTPFIKLVFNIKRLMAKVPGGGSVIGSYAAALYLIKEKYEIDERGLQKIIETTGHHAVDFLNEHSEWFMLEGNRVSPGMYKVKYPKMVNSTNEELVRAKDQIRVINDGYPVGDVFGLNIYEAVHIRTNQKIYVSSTELL